MPSSVAKGIANYVGKEGATLGGELCSRQGLNQLKQDHSKLQGCAAARRGRRDFPHLVADVNAAVQKAQGLEVVGSGGWRGGRIPTALATCWCSRSGSELPWGRP